LCSLFKYNLGCLGLFSTFWDFKNFLASLPMIFCIECFEWMCLRALDLERISSAILFASRISYCSSFVLSPFTDWSHSSLLASLSAANSALSFLIDSLVWFVAWLLYDLVSDYFNFYGSRAWSACLLSSWDSCCTYYVSCGFSSLGLSFLSSFTRCFKACNIVLTCKVIWYFEMKINYFEVLDIIIKIKFVGKVE